MEFQIGGKNISLRGSQPGTSKLIGDQQIENLLNKFGSLNMVSVAKIQPVGSRATCFKSQQVEVPRELQRLLDQYSGLFATPNSLSPHKDHDHKIILKEKTPLVNVRPKQISSKSKR